MLNRSKIAALALLALVFVAGGAAGWGVREGARCETKSRRGPDAMVERLTRELSLNPAQRDSVRAIFQRHHAEFEALWARVRPQFDSLKTIVRSEVAAQLSTEQRVRYQRLLEQAEHQRRGDSTKAGRTAGGARN